MSKSLGNCIYVKDLADKVEGMILRSLILFSPYRSMIMYSEELANQYKKEYEKWQRAYKQALYELQYQHISSNEISNENIEEFKEYMNQDFNVQNVLMLINQIIKDINTTLRSKAFNDLAIKVNTLKVILDVLGIDLFVKPMNDEELEIYSKWMEARLNKDFASADIYRSKLVELKIV
jgi:cysteinyl-tRNA synthetase